MKTSKIELNNELQICTLKFMMNDFNKTTGEIAKYFNVSRSHLYKICKILNIKKCRKKLPKKIVNIPLSTEKEILELCNSGNFKLSDVSRKTGLHKYQIKRLLYHKYNIDITELKNKNRYNNISISEFKKMVKSNKFSLGDIRKHFNISLRKINELIKKYNIKINKKSYAIELSKLNINDIINLYCEQNLSTRDVSKKLNIHRCYVSSILKTHNLMRTQKEGKVLKHYKKEQNTKFKRGYYFSVKCNKQFYYRSSYEEKFLKILDNDNRVLRYNVEPIIISSKNFYTIPDVLVELENEKILVEIKSNYGLTVKNTIDKLNVMKLYAENNNMKFIILTQDQLNSCNDWMCNNINVSLLKTNGTIQNASTDVFSG